MDNLKADASKTADLSTSSDIASAHEQDALVGQRKEPRPMGTKVGDSLVILGALALPLGLGAFLHKNWDDAALALPALGAAFLAMGAVIQTWDALGGYHGYKHARTNPDALSPALGWGAVIVGACLSAVVPTTELWGKTFGQ